jgi:hypothetical protein
MAGLALLAAAALLATTATAITCTIPVSRSMTSTAYVPTQTIQFYVSCPGKVTSITYMRESFSYSGVRPQYVSTTQRESLSRRCSDKGRLMTHYVLRSRELLAHGLPAGTGN